MKTLKRRSLFTGIHPKSNDTRLRRWEYYAFAYIMHRCELYGCNDYDNHGGVRDADDIDLRWRDPDELISFAWKHVNRPDLKWIIYERFAR